MFRLERAPGPYHHDSGFVTQLRRAVSDEGHFLLPDERNWNWVFNLLSLPLLSEKRGLGPNRLKRALKSNSVERGLPY